MSLRTYLDAVLIPTERVLLRGTGNPGFSAAAYADGSAAMAGITFDDPDGDMVTKGWLPFVAEETDCTEAPRLFTGYIGDRTYTRGTYRHGAGRLIDTTILDANILARMHRMGGTDANRPEETDSQRLAWLMGSGYLPFVQDLGLINGAGRTFEKTSYLRQLPADVLDDLIGPRGQTWFIYWDQEAEALGLFFDSPYAITFTSPLTISNVLSDVDGVTCFAPNDDASSQIDPSEVYGNLVYVYKGGVVYRNRPATNAEFFSGDPGHRDMLVENDRVGKRSTAIDLADSILQRNSVENQTIDLTVRLPKEKVGLIQAGHRIFVRLSHVPGYEDFTSTRVETWQVVQTDSRRDFYEVTLHLSTRGRIGGGGHGDPGDFPHQPTDCGGTPMVDGTPAIVQKAATGSPSGAPSPLTATFASPPTPGNEILAIFSSNLQVTPTFPAGYTPVEVIEQTSGLPWNDIYTRIKGAVKTVEVGEGSSVTVSASGIDRSTLLLFEVTAGQFTGGRAFGTIATLTGVLPDTTTTQPKQLLIGIAAYLNSGFPASPPTGWTVEDNATFGLSGGNSLLTPAWSRVVTPGTYGGTYTVTLSSTDIPNAVFAFEPCAGEDDPPSPGQPVPWAVVVMNGADGTTAFPYVPGSLQIKVDGVLISPASYTETNPECGDFTLSWIPDADEVVTVNYQGA